MKKQKSGIDLGVEPMDFGIRDWNPSIDAKDIQELTKEISGGINAVKGGYNKIYGNKISKYFEKRNRPKKIRTAKVRIFLDNMKNKLMEKDGVDYFKHA